MLKTLDDKEIKVVPHAAAFLAAKKALGTVRTEEVKTELDAIIDRMLPDQKTNLRTFSSSHLGSNLSPWQAPLSHLYHVAREMEAKNATEQEVQDRAALLFGQFIWECIMNRNEEWCFYDPNISSRDPNRDITGKIYFERDS